MGLFPNMGGQNPCFVKSNFLLFVQEILQKWRKLWAKHNLWVNCTVWGRVAADAGDGGVLIDFLGKL